MTSRALIVLTTVALLLAGCGGSKNDSGSAGGSPAGAPGMSNAQSPPEQVVVVVSITGDKVTPVNQQLQAKVKEPIVVKVSSDVEDELHVHSTPEHTFAVKPGAPQTFQFTVDVPGRVDVELHHAGVTVATITVQ